MNNFKMIRPRVWSNGTLFIVLPCDKKTFRIYSDPDGMNQIGGKFRTLETAIKAAR